MPVVTLTFGVATKLEPSGMAEGWQAREDPRNRLIKMVMKAGGGIPLQLQKFDATLGGWQLQQPVTAFNIDQAAGKHNFDTNMFGDQVFLSYDGVSFWAVWRDGTGVFPDVATILEPVGLGGVIAGQRFGVTAYDTAARDFVVAYLRDPGGGVDSDLYVRWFRYATRTWDAAINNSGPNAPNDIAYGPVDVQYQRIDGSLHYTFLHATNAPTTADLWYAWEDSAHVFQGFQQVTFVGGGWPNSGLLGLNELGFVVDTLNPLQAYAAVVNWTVNPADWANCTLLFFEKDLSVSPPVWKAGVQLSNATNQGAHFPELFCDTDGTLYCVWHERDAGANKQAVWVRQRAPLSTTWTASQKVADSILETSAASTVDAYYPGIVRAPRNVPLKYLCITWGDNAAVATHHVYINCALVRDEEDEEFKPGEGGIILNQEVRMLDLNVLGPWALWQGKVPA